MKTIIDRVIRLYTVFIFTFSGSSREEIAKPKHTISHSTSPLPKKEKLSKQTRNDREPDYFLGRVSSGWAVPVVTFATSLALASGFLVE